MLIRLVRGRYTIFYCFYNKLNRFLQDREAESCPKFKNMLRTYPIPRKSEERLLWTLHKNIFSRSLLASATTPILCTDLFWVGVCNILVN